MKFSPFSKQQIWCMAWTWKKTTTTRNSTPSKWLCVLCFIGHTVVFFSKLDDFTEIILPPPDFRIDDDLKNAVVKIEECKKELEKAKVIRKNRQEYDALAKIINQHPDRQATIGIGLDLRKAYLQIRAYLNERPPLSGRITVADPLQPSWLKLGVWLRYHLKAYENTNGAIRGFFEFCSLAQVIALQSIKFSFF